MERDFNPKAVSQSTLDDSHAIQFQSRPQVKIYHERQSKQLCALHALNNLFQDSQAFTKHELDTICRDLSPDTRIFNPHRSLFGLGCYDVNVIIYALSRRGFEVIWFDKRKDLSCLNLENIFGLILNIPDPPSGSFFAIPFNTIPSQARFWSSQKHWITIKQVGSYYYNLDSKLDSPSCIGNKDDLLQYLRHKMPIDLVEILIVVPKAVSEDQSWMLRQEDTAENQ